MHGSWNVDLETGSNATLPECVKQSCAAELPKVDGGVVECDSLELAGTCALTCSPGYKLEGESSFQCVVPENGAPETAPAFTPVGKCTPMECGAPATPAKESHLVLGATDSLKSTKIGAEVSVACKPGYQLAAGSPSKLTCAAKEEAAEAKVEWQGSPVCEKKTCALPKVENGKLDCSEAKFEDACTLSCDEGFEVSGSPELVCAAEGAFASEAECVEKKSACAWPVLTAKMASVDCGKDAPKDHVAEKTQCTVTCDTGYTATGPFTCLEGAYAAPEPVCVEEGSEVVRTSYVTGSLSLSLSALPEGKTLADLTEDKDFKNAISVSVAAGLAHPGIEAEAVEVTSLTA